MNDNFLTQEGEQMFQASEETTPPDSSPEKAEEAAGQPETSVEEVPKDLGEKPLHTDKRFKTVIEERNRYREEAAQVREAQAELERRLQDLERRPSPETQGTKPEWFKRYFGDDEEAWNGFQSMTRSAKEEAKREALQEFESTLTAEEKSLNEAREYNQSQMQSLRDEGEDFDVNELTAVMLKYKPTTEDDQLDFRAGLEILKLQKPKDGKPQARRQLASSLNQSKGAAEPQSKDYVTAADLRMMRQRGEI